MLRNKWLYFGGFSLCLFCFFLSWMKSCESKIVNKEVEKAGAGILPVAIGWGPTVTIKPSNISTLHGNSAINLVDRVEEKIRGSSSIESSNGIVAVSTGSDVQTWIINSRPIQLSLSSFGTRRAILWSGNDGTLQYKWYWYAMGLGLSYQTNGKHPGLGVDIRGLYIGDFGLQAGVGFYKGEKATPQISIGYNLRKIKIINNTDLIIGISGDKSLFGGIRCELGNAVK
jgi:hypothetical protein